jgi:hypothetical protein
MQNPVAHQNHGAITQVVTAGRQALAQGSIGPAINNGQTGNAAA